MPLKKNSHRKMFDRIRVFLKAQVSAFIGGVTDYLIMILATECLGIHYTLSIVIGGIIGAVVNFSLNRDWTFRKAGSPYKLSLTAQFGKFCLVVLNSILLKSTGTWVVTTACNLDYKISRILVDLVVSLGFNFTLQKYWVFAKNRYPGNSFHNRKGTANGDQNP